MKTLDEVIDIMEHPLYGADDGFAEIAEDDIADALHYLKEYRDRKETLRSWTEKSISEQQNLSDAITFMRAYRDDKDDLTALRAYWKEQHENNALTWDELKQMFHKPVWIETKTKKGWVIINNFEAVTPNSENVNVIHTSHNGAKCSHFARHLMGQTWQAFRKERKK